MTLAATAWALDRDSRCIRWHRYDNSFLQPSPDLHEMVYTGFERSAPAQKMAI